MQLPPGHVRTDGRAFATDLINVFGSIRRALRSKPRNRIFMRSEQGDVILWHTPYLSGYTKQFILSGHTKWLY